MSPSRRIWIEIGQNIVDSSRKLPCQCPCQFCLPESLWSENGHNIVDSPEKSDKRAKGKKVSVKTRILTNTKRIYNNKKAFGDLTELDEADALRSSAKSKGTGEKTAMLSSIPLPLDKGGGQSSKNAASSVRGKLDSAKQRAKTADAAVKGRPQADKTSTSSKGAAGKMMSSLQKLNPSALF